MNKAIEIILAAALAAALAVLCGFGGFLAFGARHPNIKGIPILKGLELSEPK